MPWGWRPYVPVAQRRARAARYAHKLAKNGRQVQPVKIEGRAIASTFWGKAWCENLERYSDFANRLPRGRTYVRNGSVIDLQIAEGRVTALVSGSEIYEIKIDIAPLSPAQWKKIREDCSQSIDSLMDLLQGRLLQGVMERLTRPREGLFPQPHEIKMKCSCPDWAGLCKHLAAVLYGVGARLDTEPELLFKLRQADHFELIAQAVDGANLEKALAADEADSLAGEDLEALFGIELGSAGADVSPDAVSAIKAKVQKHARLRAAQRKPAQTRSSKAATKKATRKMARKKPSPMEKETSVRKSTKKKPNAKRRRTKDE